MPTRAPHQRPAPPRSPLAIRNPDAAPPQHHQHQQPVAEHYHGASIYSFYDADHDDAGNSLVDLVRLYDDPRDDEEVAEVEIEDERERDSMCAQRDSRVGAPPMSAPPVLLGRARSLRAREDEPLMEPRAHATVKRRSTTAGRDDYTTGNSSSGSTSRTLRRPAERAGALLFRTQHAAPWRSRWCVLRGNVVAVYSSEKMHREIAIVHLPPDLLVLPSPTDHTTSTPSTPTSPSPTTLPTPAQTSPTDNNNNKNNNNNNNATTTATTTAVYGFMTLAVQPRAGPRPIPFFFAASTRLDMVQWISHLVRAAQTPPGEYPRTQTYIALNGPRSSSSSSGDAGPASAPVGGPRPAPMTQTTASSWPAAAGGSGSGGRKRFTFASLTQRVRGAVVGPVKRHTAPAESDGKGGVVMGAAVVPEIEMGGAGTAGGGKKRGGAGGGGAGLTIVTDKWAWK